MPEERETDREPNGHRSREVQKDRGGGEGPETERDVRGQKDSIEEGRADAKLLKAQRSVHGIHQVIT